ncbi:MAG: hypothetical protein LBQ59_00350 [Candidatus Peribacteria bacterium]|jgi:hypothetical protein|nr:hypothetical protein [Candidatus Peribacteria bacterium]
MLKNSLYDKTPKNNKIQKTIKILYKPKIQKTTSNVINDIKPIAKYKSQVVLYHSDFVAFPSFVGERGRVRAENQSKVNNPFFSILFNKNFQKEVETIKIKIGIIE